jgi:hypothetical protein
MIASPAETNSERTSSYHAYPHNAFIHKVTILTREEPKEYSYKNLFVLIIGSFRRHPSLQKKRAATFSIMFHHRKRIGPLSDGTKEPHA